MKVGALVTEQLLAGLKTRLESSLFHTGRIILQQDGEETVAFQEPPWEVIADSTGTAVRSTSNPYRGAGHLRIQTPATINDNTEIKRHFSWTPSEVLGMEFHFSLSDITATGHRFWLGFEKRRGATNRLEAWIELNTMTANKFWRYQDSAGVWQNIVTNWTMGREQENWCNVKLIADFARERIVGVWIRGTWYPLDVAMHEAASATLEGSYLVFFSLQAVGNTVTRVDIDDIIVTNYE